MRLQSRMARRRACTSVFAEERSEPKSNGPARALSLLSSCCAFSSPGAAGQAYCDELDEPEEPDLADLETGGASTDRFVLDVDGDRGVTGGRGGSASFSSAVGERTWTSKLRLFEAPWIAAGSGGDATVSAGTSPVGGWTGGGADMPIIPRARAGAEGASTAVAVASTRGEAEREFVLEWFDERPLERRKRKGLAAPEDSLPSPAAAS
eukprot:scaffold25950_cov27-Tisochrysis_lutea.AAC.1